MNKFFIGVVAVFLVLAATGFSFSSDWRFWGSYSEGFLSGGEIVAIFIMLANGTFLKTRYFRSSWLVLAIFSAGVVLQFLDSPVAQKVKQSAFLILFVLYAVHFIVKTPKGHLDILKLLTAFFFLTPTALILFRIVPERFEVPLLTMGHAIVWITFVDFLVTEFLTKRLFRT